MDDNWYKVVSTAIVAFVSYCLFMVKRNANRFDRHDMKINNNEKNIAVINEQMKHILDKLNDVVDLGIDLKRSNNTILRALARNAKK